MAAAGCGSDDESGPGIPSTSAAQLSRELDLLRTRIDVTRERSAPGSCKDIETKSYPDIQRILDGLPDDTDSDVRGALEDSIDRLKELADSECSDLIEDIEQRREETTPEVTTPPPVQTQTTPPPETQTETTPPQETTEEQPQEDQQNGNGNGNGNGQDNGQSGGQPAPPAGQG